MKPKSRQQLYESNSTLKYPFSDFHTENVSNDVVLDMCLSVPYGTTAVVSAISVTSAVFFMAIEDPILEKAIGHVIVSRPELGVVYRIQTTMDNAFGWIVLGPGRSHPFENRLLNLELDPSVLLVQPDPSSSFTKVVLDGFEYAIPSGIMNMVAVNPNISISIESRTVTGLPGGTATKPCVVLSRNDSKMDVGTIYGGLVTSAAGSGNVATSFGGAPPDDNGNVVITTPMGSSLVVSNILRTDLEPIGVLLNDPTAVCTESNPEKLLTHGKCDEGWDVINPNTLTRYQLPLDQFIEDNLKPDYALPDCGCEETS